MSFIKWVGGKSKLINKFIDKIPDEGETYYEPFIGSASVLIEVLKTKHYNHYIVGDVNATLINLFNIIKNNLSELLNKLAKITDLYDNYKDKERFYYFIRDSYNKNLQIEQPDEDLLIKMSTEFIFLNKTCFRGLYRVNKKDEFNVPYGNYKNPSIYAEKEITELNNLFKNVDFINANYKTTLEEIKPEDFVYLDPPYINTFDSYSAEKFDSEDFASFVNNLKCKCLISNSEDFKELLNENFNVEIIEVQNKINSKSPGSTRNELLAWNF